MRHSLLVVGALSVGSVMVVACGATNAGVEATDDGGASSGSSGGASSGSSGGASSGSSGGETDGGVPDAAPVSKATLLKSGTTVLLGVTSDGYAAYIAIGAQDVSLEVVPVAGGTPTVLLPALAETDIIRVSGQAVAYWTSVTAGIGTLNYWTKATGPKAAVAAASANNMFFSNPDSTRIAFSVGATATSTDFAVTTAALGTNTAVLTGNNAMNLAAAVGDAPACAPDIGFVGKVLFAAYCTGVVSTTKAARLLTVPDGVAPTPKRLDTATPTAAASIKPFWSASAAGDKLFVIGSAAASTGRIIFNAADVTQENLDADTQEGVMLADGSGVIYRVQNAAGTTKAIRHATTAATPVKADLVATAAEGILSMSPDQKHAAYHTLVPSDEGLFDIRLIGTAPPAATPVPVVATATAYPFGFTTDNTTMLYQTDGDDLGLGKLKAKPVGGGAETLLASKMFDVRALPGKGILIIDNPTDDPDAEITTVDIKWLDVGAGGTPKFVAKSAVQDSFEISGTKLVYSTFGTDEGLYSTPVVP